MRSLLLQRISDGVLPITALFAVYLLLYGHNRPGGGFIAGLVTASALILQAITYGPRRVRENLAPVFRPVFGVGLTLALLAGLSGPFSGDPFLTHYHTEVALFGAAQLSLSTALLFDLGVYLVVVGATATAVSVFSEEPE